MSNKKFMIKEEKAVFADIRSAISISLFDSELNNFDGSIDMDVRRAVIYNKIVFENLSKRLLSYYASREDNRNKKKELSLIRTLKKENSISKEKLYYLENPDENSFNFLDDVLDKNKSEDIFYPKINFHAIRTNT